MLNSSKTKKKYADWLAKKKKENIQANHTEKHVRTLHAAQKKNRLASQNVSVSFLIVVERRTEMF